MPGDDPQDPQIRPRVPQAARTSAARTPVARPPVRRAARPMRALVAVGVAGGVALGGATVVANRVAARVTPRNAADVTLAAASPVLSVRRSPQTLSDSVRLAVVGDAVDAVVGSLPGSSCLSVSWLGREVASVRSSEVFIPASLNKLATAVAALEVLGPDTLFTTEVRGSLAAGVVTGDMFLVGGGDPLLVREEYPATERYPTLTPTFLETLADAVVAAGVTQVQGSIVGDDSRYDDARFPESWPADFYGTAGGPIGGLVVSDGAFLGEASKPTEPAVTAARELRRLLINRGVTVTGNAVRGDAPATATVIAKVDSASVKDVVREMLVNSDNNTAEMLVKEIGRRAAESGSWEAGLIAIKERLTTLGLPTDNFVQADGSGLSRDNRMSCDFVSDLLSLKADVLSESLAVAGESGTLDDDFVGQPVAGRLRGKTGTLSGVKGLAGFLPVEGTTPVQFVLMMAGDGVDTAGVHRPIWNSLTQALDRASASPAADQLAP